MGRISLIHRLALGTAVALLAAGCAPAPRAATQPEAVRDEPAQRDPARTLVIAVRVEPASVAGRALREQSVALYTPKRLFNADLAIFDARGLPQPYLAEALPQLNSPSLGNPAGRDPVDGREPRRLVQPRI